MSGPSGISDKSGPCNHELEIFTKCVSLHPQGLKENDCEDEKQSFRKCMNEWKAKNKS
jgi:hypothetical protein